MKILLLAIRSLMRFRLYTMINIVGLALSLSCVIILSRYIWQEVTTDRFNQKLDRLYITTLQNKDNPLIRFSGSQNINKEPDFRDPLADLAVEKSTTFVPHANNEITYKEKKYNATFYAVDTVFLQLFDYPVLVGNRNRLFHNPEGAAITQAYARKLFGKENPIGKQLTLSIGKQVTIEGIIGEPSTKSSLHFDLLVASKLQHIWSRMPQSVALLRPDSKLTEVNKRLENYMEMKAWKEWIRYQYYPLKDLYFNKDIGQYELYTPGNYGNIQVLILVTLLILLVGLFNFINIYTVLTLKRGREFGMKKVFGSGKKQLFGQLYMENLFLTGMALLAGWACVEISTGIVESHLGITQNAGNTFDWIFSFSLLLLLPLVTSLYPFIKYNYASPITSLRSVNAGGYSTLSRSLFLVVQYIISISLIILSLFFIKQLRFMLTADPGYQTSDIIKVKFLQDNYAPDDSYDNAMSKHKQQQQQAETLTHRMNETPLFTQWIYGPSPYEYQEQAARFKSEGGEFQPVSLTTSTNNQYFQLYQLEIVEGRGWSDSLDGWGQYRIIINETAKKLFGITDINKDRLQPERRLWWSSDMPGMDTNPPYEIVGVVKDFQTGHLSKAVPPVLFEYGKEDGRFSKMNAHYLPGKRQEAIRYMKQLHEEVIGGEFSYTFVEDEIKALYQEDKKVTTIYSLFAFIAILISSLGLFGLSLFDVQQRFREIAIRKVNGATTSVVMQMLLRKYYRLLGIAFLIAVPVSWLAITRYLEDFAHKAPISWWLFAIALLTTGGISLLTLIWQIRKAAQTNPAEAIKSE